MGNLSLYDITNEFIALFEKAQNDELTPAEIEKQGLALGQALQTKSTSIIGYLRNQELMSEAIKEEIDRLTELKKTVDNKKDRFKEYVKNNMQTLNLEKVETELGTLTVAKNPASVEIYDESLLKEEYKKVTVTPDKTAIKNALKAGIKVEGARLIEDNTSLRVK